MYKLTLSESDRDAFDWVGDRYAAGEVSDLLREYLPEGKEWGDAGNITFDIPEHAAWNIYGLFEAEKFLFPSFGPSLVLKLLKFTREIV